MSRDQVIGWLMVTVAIVAIIAYTYLMFLTPYWEVLAKLTLVVAVIGIGGIIAWIGYTLATTPPPKPIEEIEKEIEEELKKLEEEVKAGESKKEQSQ